MMNTSAVAEIGSLLGDPARVNMMIALLDGRAWTASELADAAGVTPQTASSHLGKLATAGLITVNRQGRHHYHRLASPEVARLLEQMHLAGAAIADSQKPMSGPRDPAMRRLRSCYDHLAGQIAVEISGTLFAGGDCADEGAALSSAGRSRLTELGIDLAPLESGRRVFCRTCLDWSERRPHISGAVGAALLTRVLELGWVRRRANDRTLILTAAGERGLAQVFGIEAARTGA